MVGNENGRKNIMGKYLTPVSIAKIANSQQKEANYVGDKVS